MSNQFNETQEQKDMLNAVLEEQKNVSGSLMKVMQKAQDIYGYLPLEVQARIAEFYNVPLEEIYGIATFYAQFHTEPSGKYRVGICLGTACYVKGSGDILEKLKSILKIDAGRTTPDLKFTLDATRCIGCCGLAPVMTVNDEVYGRLTVDDVEGIIAKYND